ncbi:hypothetical protein BASA81_002054 [Batrachochytrium salamandrivorans]|nr:hypothetical protein BASA81_002054 [Batrachochytrium salamandrivorans]
MTSWWEVVEPSDGFYSWNAIWCRVLVWLNSWLVRTARFDFETPQLVSSRVLPKHTTLYLYSTVKEALECGVERGLPRTLNLERSLTLDRWRFQLFDQYRSDLVQTFDPSQGAEECAFFNSWQINSKVDPPLYTNFSYPFVGRKTHYSTAVPRVNNFCGLYVTEVDLPLSWQNRDEDELVLIVKGAGPFCKVFCNRTEVGFHTDSLTEHEYVIPHPTSGKLELILQVIKFASASYLEDQDQWWLTGMHRSVELQRRRRRVQLIDFHVETNSLASVEVSCELALLNAHANEFKVLVSIPELGTEATMEFPISAASRRTPSSFEYIDASKTVAVNSIRIPVTGNEWWTPETPKLYSIVLQLVENVGDLLQVETVRIGFRHIEIQHKEIRLNGTRVVFRGTNRHEFSPTRGKCVREEEMVCDLLLMKRFNFNAVRNSHYPNAHRWYELCDYYGMLVVDEANIETHGFMMGKALSQLQFDPEFRNQFLHRAHAMVARSRNHPCIVAWSLGNESGFGPHMRDCAKLIRTMDTTRLVVYEGATSLDPDGVAMEMGDGAGQVTDVIFPMYFSPSKLATLAEADRPVVLCEYAHCMGNSLGNLNKYWELFWSEGKSVFQGGFIWDWVDQALVLDGSTEYPLMPPAKQAREFAFAGRGWGYGGDFATNTGVKEDGQFCCNGLVFPDRSPKPGIFEAKYLMQPYCFALHNRQSITVRQRYDLGWALPVEMQVSLQTETGIVIHLNSTVIHHDFDTREIPFVLDQAALPAVAVLFVRAVLTCDTHFASAGHELACESFDLSHSNQQPPPPVVDQQPVFTTKRNKLKVCSGTYTAKLDLKTGLLVSLVKNGRERLAGPSARPVFTRAFVDNDLGGEGDSYRAKWRRSGMDKYHEQYCWPTVTVTSSPNVAVVEVCLQDDTFKTTVTYTFDAHLVVMDVVVDVLVNVQDSIPRVGLLFELAPLQGEEEKVRYFGRGPFENYADRKHGALVGVWQHDEVEDFHVPYVYPSENGARCDVRWVDLGEHRIACRPALQMTLSPFHISQLIKAKHQSDLAPSPSSIKLILDVAQMGVGGDVGWLPSVHDEYKLVQPRYEFQVVM